MTEMIADQAGRDRIQSWIEDAAIARWLDFGVTIDDDRFLYRLTFAERHIGNEFARALHGGVISSFLQCCAVMEVTGHFGAGHTMRAISTHCDFLRGAKAMDMQARARIVQRGRRIAFVEAEGWQADRTDPVARAAISVRLMSDETP
jgi:acyl-coenzyme A thioesterase PaaI-like protein